MNKLYFGDNLDVLREYVADEVVDLIYLDPPFNSQAQYNLVFTNPEDRGESAQAGAFRDTWEWGDEAEWAFTEIMRAGGDVARLIDALRSAFGASNMMAYLVMMTVRLAELRRKMKPSGSLYLHCDPNASHYLKVIMDAVFGNTSFRSEVIWKRSSAHNSARRWGPVHDVILFYSGSERHTWNRAFQAYDQSYIDEFYTHRDKDGRRWRRSDLTGAGTRNGETGKPWRGVDVTAKGRHWFVPPAELDVLDERGKIHWPAKADGVPMLKRYLDEQPGVPAQDLILDIPPLHNLARERLHYPTQKPVALLERIIAASSNPDDLVLDPFCGCGTTVDAAQKLKRQWIGIDIAVHAVKVIEARLQDEYHGAAIYDLEGMPRDFDSAVKLAERDKYQFQWWANYLFNPHALREQKKGADRGIDGELFFPNGPGRPWGRMLTSVKGGEHVGPEAVRAFAHVLKREQAQLGLFICLYPPTREMRREAASVGLAEVVHGDIPKLQIVAIEEWFKGKMPLLPPLQHLPSAAFSNRRRAAAAPKPSDPNQTEMMFGFEGPATDDSGVVRHLNPGMVRETA